MIKEEDITNLAEQFKACQKSLLAIGDETRQLIILVLLKGECMGMRVGDISKNTNLSRPAVSHHIKILKDAEIVKMRREGTKNYYYLDFEYSEVQKLSALFKNIQILLQMAPRRDGEDEF